MGVVASEVRERREGESSLERSGDLARTWKGQEPLPSSPPSAQLPLPLWGTPHPLHSYTCCPGPDLTIPCLALCFHWPPCLHSFLPVPRGNSYHQICPSLPPPALLLIDPTPQESPLNCDGQGPPHSLHQSVSPSPSLRPQRPEFQPPGTTWSYLLSTTDPVLPPAPIGRLEVSLPTHLSRWLCHSRGSLPRHPSPARSGRSPSSPFPSPHCAPRPCPGCSNACLMCPSPILDHCLPLGDTTARKCFR